VLIDIFGSKNKYAEFINSHKDAKKEEIEEYISFLTLLQKTEFKIAIDFTFRKSELIKNRLKLMKETYNDMEFFYKLTAQQEFVTKHHIKVYSHSDYLVARINLNRKFAKSELLGIAEYVNKIAADNTGWKYNSLDKTKLNNNASFLIHTTDSEKYIKIIHPKPVKF
jgi:hypothetical protein